jgi:hypothetical protein
MEEFFEHLCLSYSKINENIIKIKDLLFEIFNKFKKIKTQQNKDLMENEKEMDMEDKNSALFENIKSSINVNNVDNNLIKDDTFSQKPINDKNLKRKSKFSFSIIFIIIFLDNTQLEESQKDKKTHKKRK